MDDRIVSLLVFFGILVVLAGCVFVVLTQARSAANLEAVKSGLSNFESGLVTYPVTDWTAVALFSLGSLAVGVGAGLWLAHLQAGEKR